MTKRPLYHQREEIVRKLRRMPDLWAQLLADYVDGHLTADERRAETAHKGPAAYSADLRERIIAAIPPRTLSDPRCAVQTLERIVTHGCATFGLKRDPDIVTVRDAVTEARRRDVAQLQAIRMRKMEPVTAFPFSPTRGLLRSISTFSTTTATT